MTSIVAPTLADLDAAPTRSRLVIDYGHGVKMVLHKRLDGRWVFGINLDWACGVVIESSLFVIGYGPDRSAGTVTLRHPAPVWVANLFGWVWVCDMCGDCDWFPQAQHGAAMDSARNHARARGGDSVIAIGIYRPKTETNVGTLWRAAYLYGAAMIFTIGRRYSPQASDTVGVWRHIPLVNYPDMDAFRAGRPWNTPLVGVEQVPGQSIQLGRFSHPASAVYLLGAEDGGLPRAVWEYCDALVEVESVEPTCMNVAMAGSIILYDRHMKGDRLARRRAGLRAVAS